jgi:hypothetical protein
LMVFSKTNSASAEPQSAHDKPWPVAGAALMFGDISYSGFRVPGNYSEWKTRCWDAFLRNASARPCAEAEKQMRRQWVSLLHLPHLFALRSPPQA